MVRTWVFGIAYRKTMDAFRKKKRVEVWSDIPEQPDPSESADMVLNATQEARHLRSCIDCLSSEHRLAISLAFYEDMTYEEIAEVAGVPSGTIKSRVFHAKKLLLQCLKARVARQAI